MTTLRPFLIKWDEMYNEVAVYTDAFAIAKDDLRLAREYFSMDTTEQALEFLVRKGYIDDPIEGQKKQAKEEAKAKEQTL